MSENPARIHSPDPFLRAGNQSRGFAKSFFPENSFDKIESAFEFRQFLLLRETRPHLATTIPKNQKGNRGKTKLECVVASEGGATQQKRRDSPCGLSWSGGCGVAEFITSLHFENRF